MKHYMEKGLPIIKKASTRALEIKIDWQRKNSVAGEIAEGQSSE